MFASVLLVLTALTASANALVNRASATCSSAPVCPGEEGCLATTINGAKFFLQCSTDYDGDVTGTEQSPTFTDCANACSQRSGCMAFNYKNGFCYYLSTPIGNTRPLTDAVAGLLARSPSTEPAECSKTCGESITFGVGSPTICTYFASGKTFIARSELDFYGFDLDLVQTSDLTGCVQACANTDRCMVVSYSGQNCYMKWAVSQGGYNPNVAGAYLQQ